ncbi:XVIPCD domain-containing protein [Rhodanobacter sp. L36]|uniref:XVIPCD domain-containing protein n=1 Tax=Rhodanobacter sp. L36 TaxID=1747221 RepID=UPI00131D7129|nr:XVIPCD domain-containing protein [Rhodanobacter sp. L36]
MTPSTDTYALLAQDSYKSHTLSQVVSIAGVDYKVLDQTSDAVTGYQGVAYQRVGTDDIVIAHRGTEQILRDGIITDGGMVFTGINLQTPDAMSFTQRVLNEAKADAEANHRALNVTVTGHSLGGTLAEITASRYGLHGETFNAYGAAGLIEGIPKGGNQVIDHVRATDVVSAGSAHFGEVRVYATQQDIDRLNHAGYHDGGGILSLRDPLKAADLGAHGIDSFVPDSKTLGHSIINPEDAARYRAHQGMVDRYRSDVLDLRTGLSAEWEVPKLAAQAGTALGRAAIHEAKEGVHAVEHGAQYIAHETVQGVHVVERDVQHAAHAVEHTARSVAHTVHDDVLKAAHVTEHAVSQGAQAIEHGAQRATQVVEHAAGSVAHTVNQNVSQGLHATEHAVSQGVHSVEHAAQSIGGDASRAFDTLRHPGSWLDSKPAPVATPARLDHATHPDHPLFQQTREAVHRLDAEHHRTPDQRSDNLAASLVVAARRDGMHAVNHVVLSDDSTHAFAVQGAVNSSSRHVTHVETAQASNTTIEQSSMAWQQVTQQKQSEPAHAAQVTPEQRIQQPPHTAGM